jgi:guanyl-specific ribonuclease Sa
MGVHAVFLNDDLSSSSNPHPSHSFLFPSLSLSLSLPPRTIETLARCPSSQPWPKAADGSTLGAMTTRLPAAAMGGRRFFHEDEAQRPPRPPPVSCLE